MTHARPLTNLEAIDDEVESRRPLLDRIDQLDTEEKTRRQLAHERVVAMERALEAIGFGIDTLTGSLARMLAIVCDGWRPLDRWTWDRLISDPKLAFGKRRNRRAADPRKNKIDSVRRSLNELAEFGLIRWEAVAAERRRGCRSETRPVIELCRDVILAEAAGEPVAHCAPCTVGPQKTPAKIDPEPAEALATNHATSIATTPATSTATNGGRSYYPIKPKNTHCPLPEAKPETGGINSDGKPRTRARVVTRDEVEPLAESLFDRLGYHGDDGATLWRTAAAQLVGTLTEAEIGSAVRGTLARPRIDRVAAFYRLLDTQCQRDGATLAQRLAGAFIDGGVPTSRPRSRPRDARTFARPRAAPPAVDGFAATQAARLAFLSDLAALAAGDSPIPKPR